MKYLYGLFIIFTILCIVFAALDMVVPAMISTVLLLIIVFILVLFYMLFAKHKCPKCGTVFKANRWEMFLAPHAFRKRRLRCPMCNEKTWCDDVFKIDCKKDKETKDDKNDKNV